MHIYFSGIGGAGIGPLAEIAMQAGYSVSGSDKRQSSYISALKRAGITNIAIDQSYEHIAQVHAAQPIDWFVYSSALVFEQPDAPELKFARDQHIRATKRDELINEVVTSKNLKMVAIAGTHGKTTTTAMIVWLCKQLGLNISYLLPAKTSFGPMGQYLSDSEYFIIEADEFDRNFLHFKPWLSVISGVSWDHHEIFPTRDDYKQAFLDFIHQSRHSLIWQDDAMYLGLGQAQTNITVQSPDIKTIQAITLKGFYNRLDAWQAVSALNMMTKTDQAKLMQSINLFPGLSRRMEQLLPGLYTDYAHTPEKIRGVMSVAKEMAAESKQNIIVVYEPLTDRRQHYMLNDYRDCFDGATQVYWLPSYLAREDPNQRILPPSELIAHLSDPTIAQPAERSDGLRRTIEAHLEKGDLVVGIAGGGGDSLDDWLRDNFLV